MVYLSMKRKVVGQQKHLGKLIESNSTMCSSAGKATSVSQISHGWPEDIFFNRASFDHRAAIATAGEDTS